MRYSALYNEAQLGQYATNAIDVLALDFEDILLDRAPAPH
jgi:hypothetical protein